MSRTTSKYHFFWRDKSPFSNWYKEAPFKDTIAEYNCMEQFMMFYKANLFTDYDTGRKIIYAKHPSEQKKLGREVRNFDNDIWVENRERIVSVGLKLKFEQNPDILEKLKETAGLLLVEASPYDPIWGIGMEENDKGVENPDNWKGLNLLGELLTQLRLSIFKK